jgi:hypothetical protein
MSQILFNEICANYLSTRYDGDRIVKENELCEFTDGANHILALLYSPVNDPPIMTMRIDRKVWVDHPFTIYNQGDFVRLSHVDIDDDTRNSIKKKSKIDPDVHRVLIEVIPVRDIVNIVADYMLEPICEFDFGYQYVFHTETIYDFPWELPNQPIFQNCFWGGLKINIRKVRDIDMDIEIMLSQRYIVCDVSLCNQFMSGDVIDMPLLKFRSINGMIRPYPKTF